MYYKRVKMWLEGHLPVPPGRNNSQWRYSLSPRPIVDHFHCHTKWRRFDDSSRSCVLKEFLQS